MDAPGGRPCPGAGVLSSIQVRSRARKPGSRTSSASSIQAVDLLGSRIVGQVDAVDAEAVAHVRLDFETAEHLLLELVDDLLAFGGGEPRQPVHQCCLLSGGTTCRHGGQDGPAHLEGADLRVERGHMRLGDLRDRGPAAQHPAHLVQPEAQLPEGADQLDAGHGPGVVQPVAARGSGHRRYRSLVRPEAQSAHRKSGAVREPADGEHLGAFVVHGGDPGPSSRRRLKRLTSEKAAISPHAPINRIQQIVTASR